MSASDHDGFGSFDIDITYDISGWGDYWKKQIEAQVFELKSVEQWHIPEKDITEFRFKYAILEKDYHLKLAITGEVHWQWFNAGMKEHAIALEIGKLAAENIID